MTDDQILEEFYQFIVDRAFPCLELSWDGSFLYIRGGNNDDRLIGIFHSDSYEAIIDELPLVAKKYLDLHEVELYYTGQRITSPLTNQNYQTIRAEITAVWWGMPAILSEDSQLGDYIREETSRRLLQQLDQLEIGDGVGFERLVYSILTFSMHGHFRHITPAAPTIDGSRKRDIMVYLRPGSELQHYLLSSGQRATTLVVECKNTTRNKGDHVDDIAKYLSPAAAASVGLLITRTPLSREIRKRVTQHRRDNQGRATIIPMHDDTLRAMLRNACQNRFDLNGELLIELFDQILSDTA